MGGWFLEFLFVLSQSKRTQWAIALGLIFSAAILLWGQVVVSGFEFSGPLAAASQAVRDAFMHRCDKAAGVVLGSSALLACKAYRKDRRRLMGF